MPSAQANGYTMTVRALLQEWQGHAGQPLTSRPIAMIAISDPRNNVRFWIALVHLASSYPAGAGAQVRTIQRLVRQTYPAVPGMIVGDFNINLLVPGEMARLLPLPRFWKLRRLGVPTQMSGGELDFALSYNPGYRLLASQILAYWQQDRTPNFPVSQNAGLQATGSGSDHAALFYGIPGV